MSIVSENISNDNDDYNYLNEKLITSVKGHCRMITKVQGVKQHLDVYTTRYTPGSIIKCAVTGCLFSNRIVGSCDEDLFFKVCLSGVYTDCMYGKFLYYQSPEEYEHHFNTTVNEKIKREWNLKYNRRVEQITKSD
jgi:hypothetical protein